MLPKMRKRLEADDGSCVRNPKKRKGQDTSAAKGSSVAEASSESRTGGAATDSSRKRTSEDKS